MKTYKEAFLFTLISFLLIGGVIWVGIGEDRRVERELHYQYTKGWFEGQLRILELTNDSTLNSKQIKEILKCDRDSLIQNLKLCKPYTN